MPEYLNCVCRACRIFYVSSRKDWGQQPQKRFIPVNINQQESSHACRENTFIMVVDRQVAAYLSARCTCSLSCIIARLTEAALCFRLAQQYCGELLTGVTPRWEFTAARGSQSHGAWR